MFTKLCFLPLAVLMLCLGGCTGGFPVPVEKIVAANCTPPNDLEVKARARGRESARRQQYQEQTKATCGDRSDAYALRGRHQLTVTETAPTYRRRGTTRIVQRDSIEGRTDRCFLFFCGGRFKITTSSNVTLPRHGKR